MKIKLQGTGPFIAIVGGRSLDVGVYQTCVGIDERQRWRYGIAIVPINREAEYLAPWPVIVGSYSSAEAAHLALSVDGFDIADPSVEPKLETSQVFAALLNQGTAVRVRSAAVAPVMNKFAM